MRRAAHSIAAEFQMTIAAIPLTGFDDRFLAGPLTAEHRRELSTARDRSRAIRKTARVAAFNGWTTAIIAAASAPFSLTSPVSFVLTVAIALVAFNEFRGRKRILNFDPSGASILGWNQLIFLAMITAYSLWMLYSSLNDSGSVSDELKGYVDLDATLGSSGGFAGLYKQIVVCLYGGVIGLSALFQGGTAFYYFSRRRHIEDFVAETPAWVRDVQRDSLRA
jgi:hypothetical protein